MKSEPSVLSTIKSVADDQPNFEVIVYRSCEILASIERWDYATSESPFVMDIIHRVQEQGVNFKDAIRSSRESAQHGSKFCADFVTLLEVLGDSSISKDEIRDHIQSMWKIANDAHTSAQSAAEMFQVIRHGIYDITNDVPGEVVKLETKQKLVQQKMDVAEKRAQKVKVVKAVSAAGAAIAAGVSIVAFPPAMIVLPVIFPLIILVSQGIEWKLEKQVQKREKEKTSYEQQIVLLKDVADTMVEFESAVDFFAQFWIRMETILDAVSDRVDDLRGKKHLRMRLMTIRKDWEVVHSNFLDYVHKVKTLESYCRPVGSFTSRTNSAISGVASASSVSLRRNDSLASSATDTVSLSQLQVEDSPSPSLLLAPSRSRGMGPSRSVSPPVERRHKSRPLHAPRHRATKSEQGSTKPLMVVQITSPPDDSEDERKSRPTGPCRIPQSVEGPASRHRSTDSRLSDRSVRILPPSRSPSVETRNSSYNSSRSPSPGSLSPQSAFPISPLHASPNGDHAPPRNSSYSSLSQLNTLSVPFLSPRSSSVDTRGSSRRAPNKLDMLSAPLTPPWSPNSELLRSPPHYTKPLMSPASSRSPSVGSRTSPRTIPPDLPTLEELRIRRESGISTSGS